MKIEAQLISPNPKTEIFDLKNFILMGKVQGLNIEIKENSKTSLGGETMDILVLILTSSVTVAIVNGLFNTIKAYFTYKKQIKELEISNRKIRFSKTTNSGETKSIELCTGDDQERDSFISFVLD